MHETPSSPAPGARLRHLWIIGALSLAWNAFGAFDYVMAALRDPGYLARFPPQMVQVLDLMPVWVMGAWALGVWGALAGSVLLLARSRFAVHAFGASLAGLAASSFYQFGAGIPEDLRPTGIDAITVTIWIVAVGLALYSARMRREGQLR